jgi:hypothetical protein
MIRLFPNTGFSVLCPRALGLVSGDDGRAGGRSYPWSRDMASDRLSHPLDPMLFLEWRDLFSFIHRTAATSVGDPGECHPPCQRRWVLDMYGVSSQIVASGICARKGYGFRMSKQSVIAVDLH